MRSCIPSPLLTFWTVERTAFTAKKANDAAALIRTGLAFFPIHAMVPFEMSLGPVRRKKVPHARPSTSNGLPQHRLGDFIKLINPAGTEAADQLIRVQPGAKQNLIGVDIANPGYGLLVHEQWFEPRSPAIEETRKFLSSRL